MSVPTTLAEIAFSGPRAGRWRSIERKACTTHITMAGQIWMDFFIPALTPDAKIEAAGITVTAAQARAIICLGHRSGKQLPIYRSGVRQTREVLETVSVEQAEPVDFTLPKLEEVSNSAHCGGVSCGYGFLCNCSCPHCGGARMREF